MLSISKFVGGLVASIVSILLLVTVLVPVISENQVGTGVSNASAINAMINILPLLVAVGVILGVVGMYISNRD